MAEEAKPPKKKRYKHYTSFSPKVASYSFAKAGQRLVEGVCIGCGKNPCECKHPGGRRGTSR